MDRGRGPKISSKANRVDQREFCILVTEAGDELYL